MQVRLLRPTDVQIAKQLLRQLGYEVATDEVIGRIDRVLASRNHYAAVVEDREKVLGLVHVYERPALEKPCVAVVQALIVDGSLRKTGVGRILMAAAEAWARAKGLTCLVLHTRDDREDARAFYEHLGHQKAATSHLMSKALD
jgi:GNAT superfamily N-acetyltransferase